MNNADLIKTADNNTYNNNMNLREMFDNIDFDDEISIDSDKKNSQSNICNNCKDENLIEDFAMGIIICKSCGQVQGSIIDIQPE